MFTCLRPGVITFEVIFAASVAFGIAAIYLWMKSTHDFFGKRHFLASLATMFIWLLGCMMELASPAATCKVLWAQASWPVIILLPTTWSLFLFEYCFPAKARRFVRVQTAMLWGGPLVTALIVGTNDLHHLVYGPETRMVTENGRASVVYDHGPLFYALAAYLYLFLAFSIGVTLIGALRAQERFRLFFVGLFIITAVPAMANVSYVLFGVTVFGFDPTPFAFSAVLTILAWMIVNNRLMDIDAIARDVLFYSVPDPVLVLGPEGRLVGANLAAQGLLGRSLPEGGLPARDIPWLGPAVEGLTRTGKSATDLTQIGTRHFALSAARLPEPLAQEGNGMGWVLRLHDLTARRRLEDELAAERDYRATLMETSLAGIMALDGQGNFVFANAEAERIMGTLLTPGQPLRYDDPAWDFRHPDESPVEDLDALFTRILTATEPTVGWRLSFLRRSDGARRIVSLNASPHRPGVDRARIVLSVADVTDQYHYEAELKEARDRAEQANAAKSQFLANMSHEIRTPLNGVLGMAEVLHDSLNDPDKRHMAAAIRDSGEILLSILNDLLDMAKIESGKLSLEMRPFRPSDLAERIDSLYSTQADQKGLAFDVMVSSGAWRKRLGDAHRVQQVLQNLVSNALKFTAKGEVRLLLSDQDDTLIIEVQDTGIGMTPEQVSRIFDEFSQADNSVTRRFGGTGLGMSIVRHLVDMMQGRIEVESKPDVGTKVRVRLPLPLAAT